MLQYRASASNSVLRVSRLPRSPREMIVSSATTKACPATRPASFSRGTRSDSGSARDQVKSGEPVRLLSAASTKLRSVPGFPRRPGRPPVAPARHVPRHVPVRASSEARGNSALTVAATQDQRSSGPRLVDVAGASRYLGVSAWTVRDLIERGALPRVALPGVRRVLVDQRDLDRPVDASRRAAS